MGELGGRTAFVTGSGSGLGRVMAERLAGLGADVAIHDLDRSAPARYGEFADIDEVARRVAGHGVRVTAVTGRVPGQCQPRRRRLSRVRISTSVSPAYLLPAGRSTGPPKGMYWSRRWKT